MFVY